MAFDFSKLNIFRRLDARSRIFVLIGGVLGLIFLVYLLASFLAGGESATGPSRVAQAPSGLQTVPGGQQSAAFQQAVERASAQRAQQAQLSGQSAIPEIIRMSGEGDGSPCVICKDDAAKVSDVLDDFETKGQVSKQVADKLRELAKKNMLPEEYAEYLQQLVKEGKLTPEQARALLDTYTKQYTAQAAKESAVTMDAMIKSGQVPLDVANELLELQKQGISTSDYAARLQQLVKEGKLSPAAAQALLAQYSQQVAKRVVATSVASLRAMGRKGQITPDVEKALVDLEERMVSLDLYESTLKGFIQQGKITPAVADAILDEFKSQKAAIGPTGTMSNLTKAAEKAAEDELRELLADGKITKDTANFIREMIARDVSMEDFKAGIAMLVQEKRLTPELSKLKIADYVAVRNYRDLMKNLGGLQANNASADEYAEALKKAVAAGQISPEQAKALYQEYQAVLNRQSSTPRVASAAAADSEFARLQQRLQQSRAQSQASADFSEGDFDVLQEQSQSEVDAAAARNTRIQNMMTAMSGQAQQLIGSWQPVKMENKTGIPPEEPKDQQANGQGAGGTTGANQEDGKTAEAEKPVIVKAGQIIFAVLDTEANSDYPNSPIMATVVDGKYKGAKLMGKMVLTKGVTGQQDRLTLNFTLMNVDTWPKSKQITAYGIDPDTARSAIASRVNYHYMQRFGAIMATSFLQGYGEAIQTSGSTATTGIFGTSSQYPELSPANKLAVGLGKVGQELGKVTQNYVNIPPTVKVDSGVGLGILFMNDVT